MILEIADIRIQRRPQRRVRCRDPARPRDASSRRPAAIARIASCKGIESPDRYMLMIWWDTLEDHTVGFRGGPLFADWRAIVGPFFAVPPSVEHFSLVTQSKEAS